MEDEQRDIPFSDRIFDELLGEEVEWRRLVRTYPLPALAVAATGGFLLGRRHGPALVAALAAFASGEVSRTLSSFLGEGNVDL